MITEKQLSELSYAGAPKMRTEAVPGPRGRQLLDQSMQYESMARGGGASPLVLEEGFGATVKDVDGNLYIDLSAGVAVTSVGRRHPAVVDAIQSQSQRLMHGSDISNPRRTELARTLSEIMSEHLRGNCVSPHQIAGTSKRSCCAQNHMLKVTGLLALCIPYRP
jgi:4-aminobutyrate aminotransferase